MIALSHNQNIRLPAWPGTSTAKVFSVEGSAMQYGDNVEQAVARAVSRRGHVLASVIYAGSSVVSDGGAHYARKQAEVAEAITLTEGDAVEIEGRHYVVHVVPGNSKAPRNSCPVKFRLV